jgi:anthranilate synthase component I
MALRGAAPRAQPMLWRELEVPGATLRQLAAANPTRYPVLFDSACGGPLGRWSILACAPRAALWLDQDGRLGAEGVADLGNGFLDTLDRWYRRERAHAAARPRGLPFAGGWAIFVGYEVASEVEPHLVLPRAAEPWRAFALRVPAALVHDAHTDRVVACVENADAPLLESLIADARHAARTAPAAAPAIAQARAVIEEDPELFRARVRHAQEAIRAGDIYQANLSRAWSIELAPGVPLSAVYERLRRANPAPFAAFANWRGMSILSSSPERLIEVEAGVVSTRPIAGTRRRSLRAGEDAPEAAALVAHPKERAEHVMLIDLERNDLGRVCEPGSVVVDEFMVVETYAHVHHIVSNVRGRLRAEVTPVAALRAVFPGGTITGCPKFRCMQIIAQEEQQGRGAYTGSLGYLTPDGRADFNILIRTLSASDGELGFRAGAGIVADSNIERELDETRAKARGLLAALELAREPVAS